MIRIIPMGSGSSGNAMYVNINGLGILIDLGVRYRRILEFLGEEKFSYVLITHTHYDHVIGFPVCSKHFDVPFLASKRTRDRLADRHVRGLEYDSVHRFDDGLSLTLFETEHDCAGSCGFVIEAGKLRFGYVTDAGRITDKILGMLEGCEVVVIESNHDVEMLKKGPYPYPLKQRILSDHGHLSNDDCAEACHYLAQRGTKHFLLAHLSAENNDPALALKRTEDALKEFDCTVEVLERYGGGSYCY